MCVSGAVNLPNTALMLLVSVDHVNVKQMWSIFKSKADNSGEGLRAVLRRPQFAAGIRALESHGLKRLSDSYIDSLYDRLDTSRDGQVELFELVSGLSLMCGGSTDDKLDVFFELYDSDGDGCLCKSEIELLINTAVQNGFRATIHRNDKAPTSSEPNPVGSVEEQLTEQLADQLATVLAQQLAEPFLKMLDRDGNGVISRDEFKAAKDQMQVSTKLNGMTRVVYLVDRKL